MHQACGLHKQNPLPRILARGRTAIFHTKNCQTKNLWVKIMESLR